jgi:hypothetical protein
LSPRALPASGRTAPGWGPILPCATART